MAFNDTYLRIRGAQQTPGGMPNDIFTLLGTNAPPTVTLFQSEGGQLWIIGDIKHKQTRYNRNVIGILSTPTPRLVSSINNLLASSLTNTIFDYTTRADAAQVRLTNNTGASVYMSNAAIYACPVWCLSGDEGFLHDKFVDYESIAKNGERKFELGNRFVVTLDQVNKLADYHWKWNRTKRHMYTLSFVGFLSYFEPGEWYTLSIGAAGEEEYISATVECYAVQASVDADGYAGTAVSFREIQGNWKHDSNETARFFASAGPGRSPYNLPIVYVAPSTYVGRAHYYCDGTADQVEINAAISYINSAYGGGEVILLKGTYQTTSSITLLSNVYLHGESDNTIIRKNCNDNAIYMSGTAATHLTNCKITDLNITRATTDTNVNDLVAIFYVDKVSIKNTIITNSMDVAMRIDYCTGGIIEANYIKQSAIGIVGSPFEGIINANIIDGNMATNTSSIVVGIFVASTSKTIVSNNIIKDLYSTDLIDGIIVQSEQGTVANNTITNCICYVSSVFCTGIYAEGAKGNINNNTIVGMQNAITTSRTYAIYVGENNILVSGNQIYDNGQYGILIASDMVQTSIIGNYCHNNGDATGIANTNSHHFTNWGTSTMTNINSWQ